MDLITTKDLVFNDMIHYPDITIPKGDLCTRCQRFRQKYAVSSF